MKEIIIKFKNLTDIDRELKDEKTCRTYYEQVRWKGIPKCPHCSNEKVWILKPSKYQNEYQCAAKECKKKFNCLTKTIFENTKISLIIWFKAIYLCTTLSKGITSPDLAKALGITQKSAWFRLHCIRELLTKKAPEMLTGIVEADETWIGGSETNKPKSKRSGVQGINAEFKNVVVGVVARGGGMHCQPVLTVDIENVLPVVFENVEEGSTVYTDQWSGYNSLKPKYTHDSVNHNAEEYVRGAVHTGTIDGAWNLFKKKINGIHHQVSAKHLPRYCSEFSFGYTHRKLTSYDKFSMAISNGENRLSYKILTQ